MSQYHKTGTQINTTRNHYQNYFIYLRRGHTQQGKHTSNSPGKCWTKGLNVWGETHTGGRINTGETHELIKGRDHRKAGHWALIKLHEEHTQDVTRQDSRIWISVTSHSWTYWINVLWATTSDVTHPKSRPLWRVKRWRTANSKVFAMFVFIYLAIGIPYTQTVGQKHKN